LCRSRRVTERNERKHVMKTSKVSLWSGFTLVEIMIVVAIIGLLAAIAIPNFVKARASTQADGCINNMRQIDTAAQQFAFEKSLANGATINLGTDLTPYIKLNRNGSIPPCPAGGTYVMSLVGTIPSVNCSLSATVTPIHVLP